VGNFYRVNGNVVEVPETFMYLASLMPQFTFLVSGLNTTFTPNAEFQSLYTPLFDTSLSLLADGSIEIKLSLEDRNALLAASNAAILSFGGCSSISRKILDRDELPHSLLMKLQKLFVDSQNSSWFMKTNQTSGKNEVPISPICNIEHVLDRLLSIKAWNMQFENDKSCALYFVPWNEIEQNREFRLFIWNKRIITICPQNWDKVHEYDFKLETLANALHEFQRTYVNGSMHLNCSLDVYLRDGKLYLIEMNPWGNSGPGLYSYNEFPSFITESEKIFFRSLIVVSCNLKIREIIFPFTK